jgi:hypothetical protein
VEKDVLSVMEKWGFVETKVLSKTRFCQRKDFVEEEVLWG